MRLKQKIAFGLGIFYLISVIGIALSLHFCGGRLSSVKFTETAKCQACKTAEKTVKEHGCCKNTAVHAKVTDSHQSGTQTDLPKSFGIQLFFSPIIAEFFRSLLPGLFAREENKAPPLSSRISLQLYNCVFRN